MKLVELPGMARRRVTRLWRDFKHIKRLTTDPEHSRSYYCSELRKCKMSRYLDLASWRLRFGEVNSFYYFYGLDRLHGADRDDYLPYNRFRSIRDRRNQPPKGSPSHNYVVLLRDKFVFAQFASSLGFPTPKSLGMIRGGFIRWFDRAREVPIGALSTESNIEVDVFCKKLSGVGGDGVFPLRVSGGRIFVRDREVELGELEERLDGAHLLQQRIEQHPTMSMLHPASINSIRLVTFNDDDNVRPFWAALKVGTGGRPVDNVASGGLAVRVDLTNGRLEGAGMFLPGHGTTVDRHPDTGVRFDGFEIPYFHEAVRCATDLHRYLYGIHSIGWDIAIGPSGPILIEGNDDWAGHFAMAFVPSFRSKFLAMYSLRGTGESVC